MAQIFHPSFNTLSRLSIFGAVFFLGAGLWAWDALLRSPYATNVDVAREQPVPFSHAHHVSGLGIDCRYCHPSVEESRFAGMPSTKTCMTCHSVVWKDAPLLEPVRESFRTDMPLEWTRVHDLPDFAYFDHSIHVAKGIGCSSCHGRVDQMPLMWQVAPMTMEFCLDCHRDPVAHLRPRSAIYDMSFDPARQSEAERRRLAELYRVESLTDCYTCHR
jgi:hypothetical protein